MVKLAIVGTGGMGQEHARKFGKIDGCVIVAVCDVDPERVSNFGKMFDVPHVYTDFGKLLEHSDCDAVVVAATDAFHYPLSMQAIAAGKHVLCEKPLGLNYEETVGMRDAAEAAGVISMVNFTYRNSSAIQKATALVAAGELGTIRHVHAHYHQSWLVQNAWGDWRISPAWLWRLSKAHGSAGALGDIGIHLIDFASMPLGSFSNVHCRTKTFRKPEGEVVSGYTLDANDTAIITAEFTNGALGTLHTTRWAAPHVNTLQLDLFGDKASLQVELTDAASYSRLRINRLLGRDTMPWEVLDCGVTPNNYERFIISIETGVQPPCDFARGAEMQAVLDACHESAATDKTIHLNDIRL